jgi:hypothetical protein
MRCAVNSPQGARPVGGCLREGLVQARDMRDHAVNAGELESAEGGNVGDDQQQLPAVRLGAIVYRQQGMKPVRITKPVTVMSTTSVPCPCAAAFSRADRIASALVTSISSGAATTGTPLTTSKDDIQSPTYVVSQHVKPSQLLKRGARSGRHEMKWAVASTVQIQGHFRL